MTVAVAATILLFMIPSGNGENGSRLLNWKIAEDIPWGVLVLFGGGICLADGV